MISIIILAAGASTRLGRAKQTLPYKNSTLLRHTISAALDSDIGPVLVVLGANEKEILDDLGTEAVEIVFNKDYAEGLASSIKAGVHYVQEHHSECDDVILMVCDQPHVNPDLLRSLAEARTASGKPLVCCTYKQTVGVPALFNKSFFPDLLSLQGEEGGKKILLQNPDSLVAVPFSLGEIDIDTPADADSLLEPGA